MRILPFKNARAHFKMRQVRNANAVNLFFFFDKTSSFTAIWFNQAVYLEDEIFIMHLGPGFDSYPFMRLLYKSKSWPVWPNTSKIASAKEEIRLLLFMTFSNMS